MQTSAGKTTKRSLRFSLFVFCQLFLLNLPNSAHPSPQNKPPLIQICIIIDDMGYAIKSAEKFINLPFDLTLAIIPFSPYSKRVAYLAHHHQKEVMLHAPMETLAETKWEDGLTSDMQENELVARVDEMLFDIPFAVGLNNHGGSKLTQQKQHMDWLMSWAAQRQLFFIDSRTTAASVAAEAAKQAIVPYQQRDVFLDNSKDPSDIKNQLNKLIAIASKQGHAIGIGHPYAETFAVLKEELPKLQQQGIRLTTVSNLVFNDLNQPRLFLSQQPGASFTDLK